jgi:ubiquinone/menaquinone biosynthesis C-methylase UbiE
MADMQAASTENGLEVVAKQLREARDRYANRMAVYKLVGYDRPAAVRFVLDQAEGISSPVLDVGSGHGLLAIELARRKFEVISVDVSQEEQLAAIMNAQMETLPGRITFLTTDAQRVPFPDGVFGAAMAMDVLHHLANGPPVFNEMVRVVKPLGKILLAEFDREGLALVARVHQSEGRQHPVGPVTLAGAVEWFLARGLKLEAHREGCFHSTVVFSKPR